MLTFHEKEHVYKLEGIPIPSVTQVIQSVGLTNYKNVNLEILEYAGDKGTKIHQTLDYYDRGVLDEENLHPILKDYLEQWKKFLSDYNITIIESELRMFHPRYRYAGTIDKIAKYKNNNIVLLDIKSGAASATHDLQTAAYAEMYEANTQKKIHSRMCVYLEQDRYKVVGFTESSFTVFLSALSIYNWKLKNKIT